MTNDLKRYTKFYAIENDAPNEKWASSNFEKIMSKAGVATKKISKPITLEMAKIVCDTHF